MNDISAAERRLIAALDRLDHTVERTARRLAAAPVGPSLTPKPAPAATAEVSDEIAALHARQAATLEAMQMRLTEAHERLASVGEEAARLAAANDDLARANRALLAKSGTAIGADAARAALEAEVEALRAARAAEVAQMGEILDALDRMLGVSTTPRSHSTAGRAISPARTARPAREEPVRDLIVERDENDLDQPPADDTLNEFAAAAPLGDLDDRALDAVETDGEADPEALPESYDDEERR